MKTQRVTAERESEKSGFAGESGGELTLPLEWMGGRKWGKPRRQKPCTAERAAWWFKQMRRVVEEGLEVPFAGGGIAEGGLRHRGGLERSRR